MLHEMRLLDLDTLKQQYTTEAEKLQQALFGGARWEEIQDCRHRLIEYEIALHQKLRFAQPSTTRRFPRSSSEAVNVSH
jgi:hypothetical protein